MEAYQPIELDRANPELSVALAKQRNFEVISNVVDESIKAAAKAREEREKREAEDRIVEQRRERIADAERQEREAAESIAIQRRAEIEAGAAESEARKAELRITVVRRLDVAA